MNGSPPHTHVMGILNVTPDSFSDGGDWFEPGRAIRRGLELAAEGAHFIDVGGESTRPGTERTPLEEELRRVLPVVKALADEGIAVSVDTMRAEVARRSVEMGARVVNDVSGGLADPQMLPSVAELGVDIVLMHWRSHSDRMQRDTHYDDVVSEVRGHLQARAQAALDAGIERGRIIVDPGIGFAKTSEQNWELLRHIDTVADLGLPVLVGVSRKRFLGELLAEGGQPRAPKQRDAATAAITTFLAEREVWCVRTHRVREHLDAIAVANRLGVTNQPRPDGVGVAHSLGPISGGGHR